MSARTERVIGYHLVALFTRKISCTLNYIEQM